MLTAEVRAGACIHAQRPRSDGTAATVRARRRGRRSDVGGGCHTGDMEIGGVRTGTQGACDAAGRCAGRQNATAVSERRGPYRSG